MEAHQAIKEMDILSFFTRMLQQGQTRTLVDGGNRKKMIRRIKLQRLKKEKVKKTCKRNGHERGTRKRPRGVEKSHKEREDEGVYGAREYSSLYHYSH